ncbi:condensation domain-containing protein, partial [Ruminiclostridium papyrosolvens]
MSLYNSLVDLIVNKPVNKGVTFISGEFDEVFISYYDLYEKALGILYNLQKNGIRRGNELVFQIKDNYEFVCCFWACILGGIIPIPVAVGNKSEHRQKLFNIWEVLNNAYLLTDKETNILEKSLEDGIEQDKIQEVKGKTVFIEDITEANGMGELYKSTPEDIAFIQFSSGSTGDPKGVILTHGNLLTNVSAILSGICVTQKDTSLSWMPLTHDMGLIGFHLAPLAAGINQYIMDTSLFIRNPILWIKKANEHRLTILSSPNFGYKYFLEFYKAERAENWDLSNVRIIFNGAEPISVELCKKFLDELSVYGLKSNVLFNVYGMAEASLAVTFPPHGEELASIKLDREFLYIGQSIKEFDGKDYISAIEFADVGYPVTDCSVRICDNNGTVLGENTVGNIEIKGNNVTSGYYNNRNATLIAFREENWLDTGDLGFFKNGRLIVTGRAKDVIFVNGQNYYAHDVERVSEGIDGVELGKAAACGVFNRTSQKDDIILFIVYKKKTDSFVKLATNLKKHIYKHMGLEIENVIPVKSFPKTTSGKIQRYKLGEMYQNGEFDKLISELKELTNNEPVENIGNIGDTTEEALKNICCGVLGLRSVGLNENLIELGADSLKSAILASRIQKHFNVEIPIEKLFEYGTLNEILSYIKKADSRKYQCIEPVSEKLYYSVTPAQKRVFSLERLGEVGTSYNIPVVMIIEGDLDCKRLEKVFNDLVQRHESLRTSFEVVEGQTVQKIHKSINFSIETDTLQVSSYENVNEIIKSLAEKFIGPFNLFEAPLMRVKLVKLSDKKHILLLDIHHIISDGTSMGILIRDFAGLYRGENLNPLKVQYKDYAQWRNDFSETDVLKNQENYWLDRLKGELPLLSLPLDYNRPAIKDFSGDSIRFSIQNNLKEKLKKLGDKCGASLFMVLLAAYNVLLSKYSGQEDIVVGSPVAGRKHPDVSNIVGMFVNTLSLRNFPVGDKSFLYFLEEVKKGALKAFEYQDYQFDKLVEKLDIRRDISRNPLFDAMLVMQNMDIPKFEIQGLKFNQHYINSKSSKFDLTLEAVEN